MIYFLLYLILNTYLFCIVVINGIGDERIERSVNKSRREVGRRLLPFLVVPLASLVALPVYLCQQVRKLFK